MSKVISLSDCSEDQRGEEGRGHLFSNITFLQFFSRLKLSNLHHWMFHWASKNVADPDRFYIFSQIFQSWLNLFILWHTLGMSLAK